MKKAKSRSRADSRTFELQPIDYAVFKSPIGFLHLFATAEKLVRLDFQAPPKSVIERVGSKTKNPVLRNTISQLKEYFVGRRTEFELPLAMTGTPFQMRVWKELTRIPFGKTISYGEQAKRVGAGKASRAVGSANGRNPIAIIVPCHRVIAGNGGLGGYAGGLGVKTKLLNLEASILAR